MTILHGGFFCGVGENRTYIDGKLDDFDDCDKETWSKAIVEFILSELGYSASCLDHVYWMEPGYGMADGLRAMKWDGEGEMNAELLKMAAISATWKSLRLCRSS